MAQVVNFDELRRSETAADIIFIRAAMAASDGDVSTVKGSDGNYEIEFKIGGKEVGFLAFCKYFEDMHDAAIRRAAEQRLEEMRGFTKLRDAIDRLETSFSDKIHEMITEFHNNQA